MKKFRISHRTTYHYASAVVLLPHSLRLRPREGHELRIASSSLTVLPLARLSWHRDVEGNSVATASFSSQTNLLTIESEIIIEKYDLLPFDFMISDYAVTFPFLYNEEDKISLSPYMEAESENNEGPLGKWIDALCIKRNESRTIDVLMKINHCIFSNLTYLRREEEGVQKPEFTLSIGSGSCRDFASLFMAAARRLGLAARFVSGYVYSTYSTDFSSSTHAWAEVFIPGAGWKGFDPTFGTLVGAEHISVAVARRPESVPPVSGSFYGAPGSTMAVFVSVKGLV